jgi:myo-inositol-1(or 4)-monophosphatase
MDLQGVGELLAAAAADEVLPRFRRVASRPKADGSLITEADTAVQACLVSALARRWPGIPVLGEEMARERQLGIVDTTDLYWCLDPLDGTTNFAAGLPYFALSLALVRGGRPIAGWVYDPVRMEMFEAEAGKGARLNGAPLVVRQVPTALRECIALVDMKRLDADLALRLASASPYRSQRSFGAVALDWCWLAAGRCHLYLHGRQNIWDYAAGSLICAEAGAVICLTDAPAGVCDPTLFLGGRVGVGALSETLFSAWRAFLRGDG